MRRPVMAFRSILLTILLLASIRSGLAETRYITDECEVAMRRGTDNTYKIVKVLKNGMTVELMEQGENGWSRVRADDGNDGYILTRFLAKIGPPKARAEAAEQALQKSEEDNRRLREEVTQLKSRLGNQEKMEAELAHITKISSQAIAMEEANTQLTEQTEKLKTDLGKVTEDKQQLERESDTRFLLAGAGILLLGLFSGLVLSSRRRNRSSGMDLY